MQRTLKLNRRKAATERLAIVDAELTMVAKLNILYKRVIEPVSREDVRKSVLAACTRPVLNHGG